MTSKSPQRPAPFIKGLIPTLNHRGFMSESLDLFSRQFVSEAANLSAEVLDMGCAYGVATIAALQEGACVHACDMDAGHVNILVREIPPNLRGRLSTSVGALPDTEFPDERFGAILCARVLHFLRGQEIRTSLEKMYRWLRPGGKLYLVADTPYTGFWQAIVPEYERKKELGEEWPGFIDDIGALLESGSVPHGMLSYLNPLDADILARECHRVGLAVEEAGFFGRDGSDETRARHHAGVIAVKPGHGSPASAGS